MKIYVASSWRNQQQQSVVASLRAAGHEVYDFKNPGPGNHGFGWSEIDPAWKDWTAAQQVECYKHPAAVRGLKFDFDAMKWADACVMVQPCGRSAALELGWAIGAGKVTAVLMAEGQEPELMIRLADHLCLTLDEVLAALGPSPAPTAPTGDERPILGPWEDEVRYLNEGGRVVADFAGGWTVWLNDGHAAEDIAAEGQAADLAAAKLAADEAARRWYRLPEDAEPIGTGGK